MREAFITKRFNASSDRIIENANYILEEYRAKGYVLTVRQLYYQFVARDLIKNTMKEYKRIASVINDGRLAGLIDWSMLEDRTRNLLSIPHHDDPTAFLGSVIGGYAEPLWEDQPYYCEVWVEKDALVGVVERPCNDLRVPFFACRGYSSQSEMYDAGKRLSYKIREGKRVVIFHVGDHDPSGIDMTRDNDDRLNMFANGPVQIRRLALNEDQVRLYNPPPNPAKMTDTRATDYVANYGDESWELDALEPTVLDGIIRLGVESIIDKPRMKKAAEAERRNRADLSLLIDKYDFAIKSIKQLEA